MKKVTDEEVQRAVITWSDFNGATNQCMRAALEEFVANREKEEASEPAAPTITISHGAMPCCTQAAIDQASEPTEPCPKCGSTAKVQAGDMSVHECDKCYTAWETASEPTITVAAHKATPAAFDAAEGTYSYGEGCGVAEIYNSEPTITISEHKAKMREAITFCEELWAPVDWVGRARRVVRLFNKFGVSETPKTLEERVTIEQHNNTWYVWLDGVQQYAGKESTAKALHYGLIAQLKEEENE